MKSLRLFCAILLLATSLPAWALLPHAATQEELAMLPPYCAARMKGIKSPEYKLWAARLGRDFAHTHHYCNGLRFLARYYASKVARDRRFYLKEADGNLSYMVANASPRYVLMPDVYLKRATVYTLQKEYSSAMADLITAIELDPKAYRASDMLASLYLNIKQPQKALEVISEALRHNPNSTLLQKHYVELGGKLPYPKPYEAAVTPAVPPSSEAVDTGSENGGAKALDSASTPDAEQSARSSFKPRSTKQSRSTLRH